MPDEWTLEGLKRTGFVGFVLFSQLDASDIPRAAGIYVVVHPGAAEVQFLDVSTGGHHKGKDPTVPSDILEARWVDGCPVIYMGMTGNLKRRLREFRDFGLGKPIGHWGGRYIWQVQRSEEFLVGWKVTPGNAREEEKALLARFRSDHGRLPFGNINA
jgi:hypothetical protein